MRPEEFVVGLERSEHDRGLLEEREEEFEAGDAEAYDEQVAESRVEERSHHDDVLAVMKAIFESRTESMPALDELELSVQERSALEALHTAYGGREGRYNTFVFAEQRRELLEQALAALQPILALDVSASAELRESYERMTEQVSELRERLVNLEDSQDDEMMQREAGKQAEEGSDEDDRSDEGEPEAEIDAELDAAARDKPSTLFDGPDAPEKVAARSSLSDGPAVEEPAKRSALLDDADGASADGAAATAGPAGAEAGDEADKVGVLSRLGRALGLGNADKRGGDGGKR